MTFADEVCENEGSIYCPTCNGSGEGMYDGSKCSTCGGSGEVACDCDICEVEATEHGQLEEKYAAYLKE